MKIPRIGLLILILVLILIPTLVQAAEPIRLLPENPRYFEFRGKPAFLITSGEHYGVLLNDAFPTVPYLDELAARSFNLTRVFSGTYREVPGSFHIQANTLAPAADHYVAPWSRSREPGAKDGGFKFDLDVWNPAYFQRLADLVKKAGARGIVVEFTLFCPFYDENLWTINPLHPRNNVNHSPDAPRDEVYTLKHPALVDRLKAFTIKAVEALHPYDNVYFEICNEPYFGGVTLDWQAQIAEAVVQTETRLGGPRHMIAQNIANGRAKVDRPNPAVSLFNFHYAVPPDVVALNPQLKAAFGDDETGFAGSADRTYRSEGWHFLLAGGGLYNNLDYSFTLAHPAGDASVSPPTPGGGGPALRAQLSILQHFLASLDFPRMSPDPELILRGLPQKSTYHALSQPGKTYALYLDRGPRADLVLNLPAGRYLAEWLSPLSGVVTKSTSLDHPGGPVTLASPDFPEDIALRIHAR